MRPCLTPKCRGLATKTYCPACSIGRRNHTRTTAQRGYGAAHQRAAKACIAAQPWCSWCGATEDLTADHKVPGQPEFGYRTLCRSCNSHRRNGRGPRGAGRAPD